MKLLRYEEKRDIIGYKGRMKSPINKHIVTKLPPEHAISLIGEAITLNPQAFSAWKDVCYWSRGKRFLFSSCQTADDHYNFLSNYLNIQLNDRLDPSNRVVLPNGKPFRLCRCKDQILLMLVESAKQGTFAQNGVCVPKIMSNIRGVLINLVPLYAAAECQMKIHKSFSTVSELLNKATEIRTHEDVANLETAINPPRHAANGIETCGFHTSFKGKFHPDIRYIGINENYGDGLYIGETSWISVTGRKVDDKAAIRRDPDKQTIACPQKTL